MPPEPVLLITDHCQDCGTISVAATLDELDGLRCACIRPPRTVQLVANLHCLHCGRPIATVVLADPHQPIHVPTTQRCGVCGGPPIVDTIEQRAIEQSSPRWTPARRGRPSRQPVEVRP